MQLYGLTDSLAGVSEKMAACGRCGSIARFAHGLCVNCFLEPALNGEGSDRETFAAALAAIELRDNDWRLGNYQILEEIGRGGMGVIYRARQRHSRRIVALKRILSYHADSQETLARFRREAQAVASLDHPNILPIYEVGEGEDGLPFFSMKYAAGGSLLEAKPAFGAEPRRCVALLSKIARAVQHAHRQGILHRDLKPGNVMLDGQGEPLVSDFGLAKWLDASSELTRTLTLYGTPGYIAPEQARGSRTQLTPAADVYSLGAILFDLFTGRPPFLGEHALDVIHQASENPAPKLRTLAPTLDRDLETICAKCLEREPSARYHSAGDLAEDLDRWLEGRSIVARPVPAPVRLWRWSRRNPKLATSMAACLALGTLAIIWQIERTHLQNTVRAEQLAARSITVLPFLNLDTARPDTSTATALAQTLQTDLIEFGPARVVSVTRHAVRTAGTADVEDINQANRKVRARAVLTGSQRMVNGKLRLSVRLMNAATGDILFTKRIERQPDGSSVIAFGRETASAISAILNMRNWSKIGPVAHDPGMLNPAAREFIISGRELMYHGNVPDFDASIRCLKRAIALEPRSALAHAYLSATQSARAHFVPDPVLIENSEREAREALRLQPDLLEGHRALSGVFLQKDDLPAVLEEQLRAVEIGGPEDQLTRQIGLVLLMLGKPRQALSWLQMIKHRTNIPGIVYAEIGQCWQILAEDQKAEASYRQAMELQPDNTDALVGLCYLRLLQHDVAGARRLYQENRARLEASESVFSDNPPKEMGARIEFIARNYLVAERLYSNRLKENLGKTTEYYGAMSDRSALGRIQEALGEEAAGRATLQEALAQELVQHIHAKDAAPLYRIAAIEASLGQPENAIKHLRSAVTLGWLDFRAPEVDPRFDSLAKDPRFRQIISDLKKRVSVLRSKSVRQWPQLAIHVRLRKRSDR